MHVNCLWVSGQYKGQGFADQLLEGCIEDAKAKGKCGLTVLSSTKKMPFLSDPKYLKYKGFLVADTASPYYELLYLPFRDDVIVPKFRECARYGRTDEPGIVLYYSNQCPHTDKYVPIIEEMARQHGNAITVHSWKLPNRPRRHLLLPRLTASFTMENSLQTRYWEIISSQSFWNPFSKKAFTSFPS